MWKMLLENFFLENRRTVIRFKYKKKRPGMLPGRASGWWGGAGFAFFQCFFVIWYFWSSWYAW
jgi:hypothetical protein